MKHRALLAALAALLLAPALTLASPSAPNDPRYPDQWGLAQVGATCAWATTTGSPDVTVAVVDSGVDMNHPDLVDRLRTDGRDFVDGDNDPSDENGHGTNVAGIIAATLDNAEGVVGLAPGVKILPVRVMNAKGAGSDRAIARGVRYAADQGAQVINLSLGATLTIDADTVSAQVTSAIRYAQGKGALVVVAAGNDFLPLENAIVGDNPDVLVVAATDENDVKADFSNSGPWVGVTAPGVHILSTMPTYDVYLTKQVPRDERFDKNYDYMSGTSQATPFVSALAALLFSAHPDWDARQVEQTIKDHAADISQQNATLFEKGYLGSGRIDACAALGSAPAAEPTAAPAAPEATAAPAEATPTARPTERPTPRPTRTPAPLPGASSPATPNGGLVNNLLLIGGVLACGAVLMLALLLFALFRIIRGPKQAPAGPPAYAPAPVAQPAPIQPVPTPATAQWGQLTVVRGPAQLRAYPLAGSGALIGRGDDCAVMIVGDGAVSRRHALIRFDGRQITLEDAGSTHGTYLGGLRVSAPVPLRRGDFIQVGQTLLRFD
jgi:type VII secretion-associated serine protease mycosin